MISRPPTTRMDTRVVTVRTSFVMSATTSTTSPVRAPWMTSV